MALAVLDMVDTGQNEGAHCSGRHPADAERWLAARMAASSPAVRAAWREPIRLPAPSPILRAMNLSRSLPWLIAAAALAGALGLYLGQRHFAPASTSATVAGPATRAAVVFPQPRQLVDFQLERSNGEALTLADWRGNWSLVFIGFTHCPDACPQTLAFYRDLVKDWPASAGDPPPLYFVSVDPERDTADALKQYASYFSDRIVAATGSHEQLAPFTRQLGMVYMATPTEGDDYTVDHSTQLAVIDPDARLHALFRAPLDVRAIIADMQALKAAKRTATP